MKRPTKWEQAKALYSECSNKRVSYCQSALCILAALQRQAEEQDSFPVEKGKALGVPWLETAGLGKAQVG